MTTTTSTMMMMMMTTTTTIMKNTDINVGQDYTNPGCQVALATKCVRCELIFVDHQYGTFCMSPCWRPEF